MELKTERQWPEVVTCARRLYWNTKHTTDSSATGGGGGEGEKEKKKKKKENKKKKRRGICSTE